MRRETRTPRVEAETAALVTRAQSGDTRALRQLHARLEVTIVAALLHYREGRPPGGFGLAQLERHARTVLAELVEEWRPGASFLAFFHRAFPGALARSLRELAPMAEAHEPEATAETNRSEIPEGPYSAEELARLPEIERRLVLLYAFELVPMHAAARQLGISLPMASALYARARARLAVRRPPPDRHEWTKLERVVKALHTMTPAGRRIPGRRWLTATLDLTWREYEALIGQLEAAGALRDRSPHRSGRLVERTAAGTLRRVREAGFALLSGTPDQLAGSSGPDS